MAKKAVKKAASKKAVKGTKAVVNFAQAAAGLDDAWNSGAKESVPSAGGGGGANAAVADGEYIAQLTLAKVGMYKKGNNAGKPYLQTNYLIAFGECAGETVKSYDTIDNEVAYNGKQAEGKTNLMLVSERLQMLGVNTKAIKSVKELPEVCDWLVNPKKNQPKGEKIGAKTYCRIYVKNDYRPKMKDGVETGETAHYQNVSVNGELTATELAEIKEQFGG